MLRNKLSCYDLFWLVQGQWRYYDCWVNVYNVHGRFRLCKALRWVFIGGGVRSISVEWSFALIYANVLRDRLSFTATDVMTACQIFLIGWFNLWAASVYVRLCNVLLCLWVWHGRLSCGNQFSLVHVMMTVFVTAWQVFLIGWFSSVIASICVKLCFGLICMIVLRCDHILLPGFIYSPLPFVFLCIRMWCEMAYYYWPKVSYVILKFICDYLSNGSHLSASFIRCFRLYDFDLGFYAYGGLLQLIQSQRGHYDNVFWLIVQYLSALLGDFRPFLLLIICFVYVL